MRASAALAVALASLSCTTANPAFDGNERGTTAVVDDGGPDGGTSATMGADSTNPSEATADGGGDTDGTGSCGDGVVDDGEACDLGPDNGQLGACQLDCTANLCGDGFPAPNQPCDDGNDVSGDGCTECELDTCQNGRVDPGEACDPSARGSTDCTPLCQPNQCGDGYVAGIEECDDADVDDTDDCTVGCRDAACGDGHVWVDHEQCDDANADDHDACVFACVEASCGDGVVWSGNEECDGGDAASYACAAFGYFTGVGSCSDECVFDGAGCTNCGDATVDDGEQCDWGAQNGVPLDCGARGWVGDGQLVCDVGCGFSITGDCCLAAGYACVPDAPWLCCGGNCDGSGEGLCTAS